MRLIGIDHVQSAMPPRREPEARAFFVGLLSLAEQVKPAVFARRGGCWFANDAVTVHLGVELDFKPASKAHPAFLVDISMGLSRDWSPRAGGREPTCRSPATRADTSTTRSATGSS